MALPHLHIQASNILVRLGVVLALTSGLVYRGSAAAPLSFVHIGREQGLNQGSVICVIQDKTGFIWFGTTDGLYRFDGYTCREFRHIDNDTTSLSHNYISSMLEDNDGYLWIATNGGGLNRFNPFTEKFRT